MRAHAQLVRNPAEVKALLQRKVQEETLRTYVLTFSSQYSTLSLKSLCTMFDLSEPTVKKLLSKMMVNEQLAGAWDQPAGASLPPFACSYDPSCAHDAPFADASPALLSRCTAQALW